MAFVLGALGDSNLRCFGSARTYEVSVPVVYSFKTNKTKMKIQTKIQNKNVKLFLNLY